MVPFPLRDGDYEYNDRKITSAKYRLRHNPDFHRILTPPMKENVKKSDLIYRISYSYWEGARTESLGDSIAYGIPNYLIRLVLAGKGADLNRIAYHTHSHCQTGTMCREGQSGENRLNL
ncbi:hypothetical protein [Thermococcus sp.]